MNTQVQAAFGQKEHSFIHHYIVFNNNFENMKIRRERGVVLRNLTNRIFEGIHSVISILAIPDSQRYR